MCTFANVFQKCQKGRICIRKAAEYLTTQSGNVKIQLTRKRLKMSRERINQMRTIFL